MAGDEPTAEERIQALLEQINRLEVYKDGEEDAAKPPSPSDDRLRLYGVIQRILHIERNDQIPVWEVEKKEWLADIQTRVAAARKDLDQMEIPSLSVRPSKVKQEERKGQLETFDYQGLPPGPTVRKRILGYLSIYDQLNVASAMPSEIQYLSKPPNKLLLNTVFPILMQHGHLGNEDLFALSCADPYFRQFINRHFEDVLFTDLKYIESLCPFDSVITLEQIEADRTVGPVASLVHIPTDMKHDSEEWKLLQKFGAKLMSCVLVTPQVPPTQHQLQRQIASCLEQLPNLQLLYVFMKPSNTNVADDPLENQDSLETALDLLPPLPFLKTLLILERHPENRGVALLMRTLLQKYAPNLQFVSMNVTGYYFHLFKLDYQIPADAGAKLTKFRLVSCPLMPFTIGDLWCFRSMFHNCPLKMYLQRIIQALIENQGELNLLTCVPCLFAGVGCFFGNTLEEFYVQFDFGIRQDAVCGSWGAHYMLPKLKVLEVIGCPQPKEWAFLLGCPQLEKLRLTEVNLEQLENDRECFVQLHNEKEKMLLSNAWKVCPKLEEITWNVWGNMEGGKRLVKRREAVSLQIKKNK